MLHETAQIHQKHIMHFSDHCQAQLLRQTLMRSGTPVLTAGACANECIRSIYRCIYNAALNTNLLRLESRFSYCVRFITFDRCYCYLWSSKPESISHHLAMWLPPIISAMWLLRHVVTFCTA